MLGHFQIYVVLFMWSLSRSVGEKDSVYAVRRGKVRSQNTIAIFGLYKKLHKWQRFKKFQAVFTFLRLCATKDLKELVLHSLPEERGREELGMLKSVTISGQEGGCNIPGA